MGYIFRLLLSHLQALKEYRSVFFEGMKMNQWESKHIVHVSMVVYI